MANPILSDMRVLYGVRVPAVHFDSIKRIADLLVGRTDHREYLKDGQRRCAEIALRAWNEARTPSQGTPAAVSPRPRPSVVAARPLPLNVRPFLVPPGQKRGIAI